MTAKEWRNHADERIAALFAAIEATNATIDKNAKTMNDMFAETNRQIKADHDKTQETINELMAMQIRTEQRLDRVIEKVDSWLEGLQPRNGKQ